MSKEYNVLFLCTGNSARSVMAETLLNHWGNGLFHAHSAGSHPAGRIHPLTLDLLMRLNFPLAGLRSKSWDEFAKPAAPKLDFVFTVCDNAAKEVCPFWPGQPQTAHWGVPDPAVVRGTEDEIKRAYRGAFMTLERRISLFLCLSLASIDKMAIKKEIDKIGQQ